ncbi:MAG: signal peptide peptidase SppA [Prevotella sp.]|nr:signal peptide peptidase SppA [Prevotella sp.]
MKEFFKMVFATMLGIFLFMFVMGIFFVMGLVGMVASGSSVKSVEGNSVMVLNLSGQLDERASSSSGISSMILGSTGNEIGLDDVLTAIKKAKANEDIKGIYIEAGMFSSDSYASLQAFRRALEDFKKSGKWIIAYADTYTQGSYYLASVANKVYINPEGQIDWHGIASTPYFLKDALEKFGVKIQLTKVGAYKSAPEMYTSDHMSEPNREQVTAYINGIWENVLNEVSKSRNIPVDSLNAYADNMITFTSTKDLLAKKMVDGVCYTDEVKALVKKQLKMDEDDDIPQLTLADMANVKDVDEEGDEIAIYYAIGDIVDGDAQSMTSQGPVIDAQVVCKDLAKLAEDDDVKAVVLRINSGGGSAYASEQIWHQIEMLKKKKTVVTSMGGMAASGGYYISCNSNWIVAEPTTLTGSIGIFGMIPDYSGLLKDKLGVKFDEVKTNKNSAFGTMARPMNEEEMGYLDAYVDRGYKLFRKRVADGRKLGVEAVEAIAQGRVWLGQDAYKNKLVDQLGSLDDAVAKAAKLAKLDNYHTAPYPAVPDFFEQLMSSMDEQKGNYLDEAMRASLGEFYEPMKLLRNINRHNAIQARMPFVPNIH